MTTIHEAYINALLADATYALAVSGPYGGSNLKDALNNRMTSTLANFIGNNFEVIENINTSDDPLEGSGFDATVWRGTAGEYAGKTYVTFRGSEDTADFVSADLDLTLSGVAKSQIIDMVNWWLKNTTASGQQALQIKSNTGSYELASSVPGTGVITDVSNVIVNGHSLGGHLAAAFSRLFGNQINIEHVYTYNSAGFTGNSENIFSQIESLLGPGISTGSFQTSIQTNFYAENGINATTRNFENIQIGFRQGLFNEEDPLLTTFANHFMYKLTDSLALADTISKLDSTFDITKMSAMFDRGSNLKAASLESVLDSFRKLLIGNSVITTLIGDVDESAPSRLQFYQNLTNLQNSASFQSLIGKVTVASPTSSGEARSDLGLFLSLYYLLPFALKTDGSLTADQKLSASNPDISTQFKEDLLLSSEQLVNGEAYFSNNWIADRAAMLSWVNKRNFEDANVNKIFDGPDSLFWDEATQTEIQVGSFFIGGVDRRQFKFGDENSNFIEGGNKNDRLYGMGGNDTIVGGSGDDVLDGGAGQDTLNGGSGRDILYGGADEDNLNGGAGNDRLMGGAGVDAYQFSDSYGIDIVDDSDGQGVVLVNNIAFNSASLKLAGIYKNDITGYTFTNVNGGNTLIISKENDPNRIIINNWSATNNLGITLNNDAPITPSGNIINGDIHKSVDDKGTADPYDDVYFYSGLNYINDGTEVDARDMINGTSGNDVIYGFGGDDFLSGGAGVDYIYGGADDDLLQGGTGTDYLYGGDGNDVIYAGAGVELNPKSTYAALTPTQPGSYTVVGSGFSWLATVPNTAYMSNGAWQSVTLTIRPGDAFLGASDVLSDGSSNYIDGGSGNDYVIGSSGSEYVLGGSGSDTVIGYSGDDIVFGGADNDFLVGDSIDDRTYTGNDILDGGSGNDIVVGSSGDDILYGGAGDDHLWGDYADGVDDVEGNDFLFGGAGDDQLAGGAGNDYLDGGGDNDTLYGGAGDDILIGGAGADTFIGGTGADTIYLNLRERDQISGNRESIDTVIYDIKSGEISQMVADVDANGTVTTGVVRVGLGSTQNRAAAFENSNSSNNLLSIGVSLISDNDFYHHFADGYILNSELLGSKLNTSLNFASDAMAIFGGMLSDNLTALGTGNISLYGGDGNDILTGNSGDNTLVGGDGDDNLFGGTGNNLYVMQGNSSPTQADKVYEKGVASFKFGPGIVSSDLIFAESGAPDEVLIRYPSSDAILSSVRIILQNNASIGSFHFADGPSLTFQQLIAQNVVGQTITGSSADDSIEGSLGNDVVNAGAGDDVIDGSWGDDVLNGEDGNDYIHAAYGDDQLNGGDGNDRLYGNAGNDILSGGNGDDELYGGVGSDILIGGKGNDRIYSYESYSDGNDTDTYIFSVGDGVDTLSLANNIDIIKFTDVASTEIRGLRTDTATTIQDSIILDYGINDSLIITNQTLDSQYRFEAIEFSDGVVWTYEQLIEQFAIRLEDDENFNDYARFADASNKIIYAGAGNDTVIVTAGNNFVYGEEGNDTLQAISTPEYSGSSSFDDYFDGGLGNDTLSTGVGNDTLIGGAGDDILDGGTGNNLYLYDSGFGNDQIITFGNESNVSVNTIKLNSISSVDSGLFIQRQGNLKDIKILFSGVHDSIQIRNFYYEPFPTSPGYFVENPYLNYQILFADGVIWDSAAIAAYVANPSSNFTYLGTDGDDIFTAGSGNDVLIGGLGNDLLTGGDGIDTYIFGLGDGQDQIYAWGGVTPSQDILVFKEGIHPADVTASIDGSHLKLSISGTSDSVIIQYAIDNPSLLNLNEVHFFDGTIWNAAQIVDLLTSITGTSGNDNLVGTADDDKIYGLAGNDTLSGLGGNDKLDGGLGADTMTGGTGDDTYIVDDINDVVIENSNQGYDVVEASVSYTLSANVEDLTLTGSLAINGTGNALVNTIYGNSADNVLDGKAGADTMVGGLGNDTYIVDNAQDIAFEEENQGIDTVLSSVTYTLAGIYAEFEAENLENLTLTGTSAINGTGNSLDNILIGNSANNTLNGGDGNDTLNGGAGTDTLIGGNGNDTYIVDSTTDTITETVTGGIDTVQSSVTYTLGASSNLENLTLTGTAAINGTGNTLNNVITGNSAANTLNGGTGVDTLIGGDGDDIYVVDTTTDIIIETSTGGIDTVQSSVTFTLGANVENLTLTGTTAINGTGNELDNVITGTSGNNTLNGGDGNDTLNGGAGTDILVGGNGNDTYIVDSTTDTITETATGGIDTVQSSVTFTLGATSNLENLTLTGTTAINGTGNSLDNILIGNSANNTLNGGDGNDTLNGGAGTDTLVGGNGNDTYIIDSTTDTITETSTGGVDTVQSSVTYTLGATSNLENLTLAGTAAINGTGNTLNNVITGNSAANTLNGGTGVDTLIGGDGDDIYVVDTTTDTIIETATGGVDTVQSSVTFTLGANVENLTLTGTAAINGTGNELDNVLTGTSGNNTLTGGAGNDTLNGGAGTDILIGGDGNDTYIVDSTTDTITETSTGGIDTVQSSVTFTLGASSNLENLTLTGTTAINGTGNSLDNILIGNSGNNTLNGGDGNDTLNGGAGTDTLVGGNGNDTYIVDSTTDTITETSTGGVDTVQSSVTFTLGASSNLENLTLTGTAAINGTGNSLTNFLLGNSANNTLTDTAGGNDILQGLGGVDTLNDTSGNNLLDGGVGADVITAGNGSDLIIGGRDNETITTGNGYDVIMFNKGDGADTVNASVGTDNTLSLGGNFAYSDLSLTKSTNDLILKMGSSDQITFKGWYNSAANNKSILNLQVIAEAVQGFSLGGTDTLRDNKIETFNFANLVTAFDTAGATANWQLTDARLAAHLSSGSDTSAIGGDIAYQYGKNGALTDVGFLAAQNVLSGSSVGQSAQTLNDASSWSAEVIKLA